MALRVVEEHRKLSRVELQGRVEIDVLHRPARVEANAVNLSEGGMCVRLQEALEIRSRVRLRWFAKPPKRPLECAGQVAWVVQRLDLRDAPPFVYDVGVTFVNPPPRLRQFASRAGVVLKPSEDRPIKASLLRPATLNNRWYVPRLESHSSSSGRWHLIVTVDGVPCFSHRYPSEREAIESWERFKRHAVLPASRTSR